MPRAWKYLLGLLSISLLLLGWFSAGQAAAANPTTMSFQGKVVNADGTNVADGSYGFVFKLYSVSSAGTALWTETQASVAVTAGVFQVNLGSSCPFQVANTCNNNTPIDFTTSSSLYLGITFNGDAAGEMTPRVQMQSVPYAFNADTANKLGGLTAGQFVQLSPGSQQTGNLNISGTGTLGSGLTVSAGGAVITGNSSLTGALTVQTATYTSGQLLLNDGQTSAPPTYPTGYLPALSVVTSQTSGSRPLFFGYNNGAGGYAAYFNSGACGAFTQMCLDLGNGATSMTALENIGTTLNVGGGDDGNFTTIALKATGGVTVASNLSLAAAAAGSVSGASNQSLTIQSVGTGQLIVSSASGTLGLSTATTTLQRVTTGTSTTTTVDLKDTADTTLQVFNSGTGVSNLQLYGGGLCTGSAACTTGGATMRLTNAGDLTNIGNITSKGSLTGGVTTDTKAAETAAATYTETGSTLSYNLSANSTTTAANFTTTFNITGLPAVDGTMAFVNATTIKGATGAAQQHTVVIQVAGTVMSTLATANQAATSTATRTFTIIRLGGTWQVAGTGLSAVPANTASNVDLADYAEYIEYDGQAAPQPGEILSAADVAGATQLSAGRYDHRLLGVVSTTPYDVAGADDGHSVIIALTGRVPVKVSTENGPIEPGDRLTSSSQPGVAMKAMAAGRVIGTALGNYDGSQTTALVDVQLAVGYDNPDANMVSQDLASSDGLSLDSGTPPSARLRPVTTPVAASTGLTTDPAPISADATDSPAATVEPLPATAAVPNVAPMSQKFQIFDAAGQPMATIDPSGSASFRTLNVADATVSGNLVIAGNADFNGLTTFQKLATFFGKTIFRQDVQVDGHLIVSNSSAGYASLRSGESTVHVTFEQPYDSPPVVSSTIINGQFAVSNISNLTAQGFDINLQTAAAKDIKLAWTALAVTAAQTATNPPPPVSKPVAVTP